MRLFGKLMGVAIVACIGAGCQDVDDGRLEGGPVRSGATVQLALSGADFSGHSVQVVGRRVDGSNNLRPADTQYRCDNAFDHCFDLAGTAPTLTIPGLCASTDYPQNGYWTFDYALHTGPCAAGHATGERLNDADSAADRYNLQCYDSADLYTRSYANQSWQETLLPGTNENSVVCMTTNASNTVGFSSCSVEREGTGELVLDCGCTPVADSCECDALSDGAAGNLQSNGAGRCVLDPDADVPCSVVCCATGLTACTGRCVDTTSSTTSCGSCGNVCAGATPRCVSGSCVP